MFNTLSTGFYKIVKQLTGQGRLTPENIKHTLDKIYHTLIDADVAVSVAKAFIESIQEKVIGHKVISSLEPGQVLIKLVHDELVILMSPALNKNLSVAKAEKKDDASFKKIDSTSAGKSAVPLKLNTSILNLNTEPPVVIIFVGQQGCGKTTTTAKVAYWLKRVEKKSVLVVSTDIYRPAAIQQLETLAKQIDVTYFPSHPSEQPVEIAQSALAEARKRCIDVVLIDTAGRTHTNDQMMREVKALCEVTQPTETLLVVDSMMGQDAANMAKTFHRKIALTGIILTKADGDARGGAALSMRHITGKPIKFMGVGEKLDALEAFYPDRIASRILGMGDVISLVEQAEQTIDHGEKKRLLKKLRTNKAFDLNDVLIYIDQITKMGGMMNILNKLPMIGGQLGKMLHANKNIPFDEKKLSRIKAIIRSMTPKERCYPNLIKRSRKERIAPGSGTTIQDINQVLKQCKMMKKMIKGFPKNNQDLASFTESI